MQVLPVAMFKMPLHLAVYVKELVKMKQDTDEKVRDYSFCLENCVSYERRLERN